MENIISKYSPSSSINNIGNNTQVLQILLKKHNTIIVNTAYVSYTSTKDFDEKAYHEDNILALTNKKKVVTKELIRLKNINESFEYIGLSNQGKIMQLMPMLYDKLFIRYDSILSFNDSINLIEDIDVNKILDSFFFKICGNIGLHKFYLIESSNHNLLNNNQVDPYQKILPREYVYLSSNKLLIEKRLGNNESITININGLLVFEKSISFSNIELSNKTTSSSMNHLVMYQDVIIHGPGFVIFEIVPKAPMMQYYHKLIIRTTVLLLICHCILIVLFSDYFN